MDKRISVALLDDDDSDNEVKKAQKLQKLKDKVQVERASRSNALLRLNDSVAGYLLKQSIDKEKKAAKKS